MSIGREELKNYFRAGELPTEKHFADLIDATLNMEDEGFRKSRLNGLEITSAQGEPALVTFFRKENEAPLWTLQQSEVGTLLTLSPVEAGDGPNGRAPLRPLLGLRDNGRLGVGTTQPQHTLDVAGVLGTRARTGTYFQPDPKKPPLPDGEWHVLATGLSGCVGFEVTASASDAPGEGRHAVLHAVALNAYNPVVTGPWSWGWARKIADALDRLFNRKKRIHAVQSWFGQRCDRLELAWRLVPQDKGKQPARAANGDELYELVIRSMCKYGPGSELDVRVTQLWPVAEPEDDAPRSNRAAAQQRRTAVARKAAAGKPERTG